MKKSKIIFLILFFTSFVSYSQSYTKSDIIIFITKYKNAAIKKMNEHGIPASVTLAQGILESAAGTSELAQNANNHFGIKCGGAWNGETYLKDDDNKNDCFRKYNSVEESYEDHSQFLLKNKRYAFLFDYDSDDYISWSKGLQDAGYATNPEYSKILVRIIEEYELYNYDKNIPKTEKAETVTTPTVVKPHESESDAFVILGIVYRPVSVMYDRNVYINNHTRFIVAKEGDTYLKIAEEFFSDEKYIRKYNDVSKTETLKPGEIVYIESKRSKGAVDFHIVTKGETIHQIAQFQGIKQKSLMSLNSMNDSYQIVEGESLWLKKKRPQSSKPSY
ncbi:MAG: glucosaminidase domain-containing protein [Bacteroidales bacterium]|jgi:LysM repeat protein|nr:LysM peptidoglycan-binding domain-containing protein [Bacteroidales bacterium]